MSETGSSLTRVHVPLEQPAAHSSSHGSWPGRTSGVPIENDATVISKSPPVPPSPGAAFGVDIGRQLEGQQLGHFELREFVGGGGMGSVFRSLDMMLNRVVAVKVLAPDQSRDEDTLKRFKNEAQSAARLDHENIGRVYYVGEDRGLHYIVFEFIEGVNLRDLIEQRGPLSLSEAVNYTFQVADALEHASRREVVHRDIKPSNVVITPEGRAKLVDMGLARLHQVDRSQEDLTASGVTLGTFDYISPEQARDPRSADVRSDLYSLGCTFYFMLTGRPPFPEGTVLQKLLQHQGDEPPDPRQFRSDLPESVARIVRKMLAKAPDRRYQRPSALITDLMLVASELGLRQRTSAGMTWVSQEEIKPSALDRHLPWLAPSIALIVIVLGLHFFWTPAENDGLEPFLPRNGSRASLSPTPDVPEVEATSQVSKSAGSTNVNGKTGSSAATVTPVNPASSGVAAEPQNDNSVVTPVRPLKPFEDVSLPPGLQALLSNDDPLAELAGSISAQLTDAQSRTMQGAATQLAHVAGSVVTVPPKAVPPERKGILVVGRPGSGADVYTSLRAACADARSGDVIELQYNGVLEERPFELTNLKLKIRAHAGYQPVVSFRPTDIDPTKYPRSMITVSGGQLTLMNVHLLLEIPKEMPAEMWTLIEARRPDLVRLESCSLTIRNGSGGSPSFGQDAAFIQVKSVPGDDGSMMDQAVMPAPVSVQLENCIARGEAVFLRSDDLQPLDLTWDNGLLATTERFLMVSGGPVNRPEAGELRIDLQHLTAVTLNGFCHFSNSLDAPLELTTTINCADSILMAAASSPLIEQVGADSADEFRQKLIWNGDRNFYQGYTIFWKIVGESGRNEPILVGFDEWQEYWTESQEKLPSHNSVSWQKLPASTQPTHWHLPEDYALAGEPGEGSPRLAGGDGRDAGVLLESLPTLPVELTTAATQPNVTQASTATPTTEVTQPKENAPAGTMRTMKMGE